MKIKTETTADILSEIRDFCGEVLTGSQKVVATFFLTHREARELKSACECNDVGKALIMMRSFRGEPNPGALITRLEDAVVSDALRHRDTDIELNLF